jgi:hypothetical protein
MDKRFAALSVVVMLIATIALAYFAYRGPLARYTQASNTVASREKSIILAYPLTVKVGGEKCKIDVFLTSDEDHPVRGKQVTLLTKNSPVTLTSETDENGQATFQLTGRVVGPDEIGFAVDGTRFPATISLTVE